jgi:hypothetical protein
MEAKNAVDVKNLEFSYGDRKVLVISGLLVSLYAIYQFIAACWVLTVQEKQPL